MAKSTPSLLALLGLVAVAGYQNRGKISEMLANTQTPGGKSDGPSQGGGFLAEIGALFGSKNGALSGGLRDLADRFNTSGRRTSMDSWISNQDNIPVAERDIEEVLGDETIGELSARTGLSRDELLQRLSSSLPEVVNGLTPKGRLPSDEEADTFPRGENGEVTLRPPAAE